MAESDLSAQVLRKTLSYDRDTGIFTRARQSKPCGRLATKGYRQICVNSFRHMAHRLAWLYVYGEWPDGQIDHINQHKDDNRIDNLRVVNNKQNQENVTAWCSNTSGRRGVRWHSGKNVWVAEIKHHSQKIHLGSFDNIIDAVSARIHSEHQLFTHSVDYAKITHLLNSPNELGAGPGHQLG